MTLHLACDYDETLASGGQVTPPAREALLHIISKKLGADRDVDRSALAEVVATCLEAFFPDFMDQSRLRFSIGEVALRPFYESYGRYSVYLNVKPK